MGLRCCAWGGLYACGAWLEGRGPAALPRLAPRGLPGGLTVAVGPARACFVNCLQLASSEELLAAPSGLCRSDNSHWRPRRAA